MQRVRTIIADDSVVYRSQIRAALESLDWVEVVGSFSNGRLAIEALERTTIDVLILDLEMPEMDGLSVLKALKGQGGIHCKVLVFSSLTQRGAEITLEALHLGASDFVTKPDGKGSLLTPSELIRNLLEPKLRALFPEVSPIRRPGPRFETLNWDVFRPELVVIGSSTGGPTALEHIFSRIAAPQTVPILIVQHMPPVFTATFAERLSKVSGLDVREARHGERLENSRVYIAPGDFHLSLKDGPLGCSLVLDQGPHIHSVRPCVDRLFETAAPIFKNHCLGIVLTGMGSDGRQGATEIKNAGGYVLIQNPESCVVFGMPGAVAEEGAFDRMGTPSEIAEALAQKAVRLSIGDHSLKGKSA